MRNFLVVNLLITILLATIGAIIFVYFLPGFYHILYPVLLLLALVINLLSYYFSIRTRHTGNQIMNAMIKSFALRFFSYLGIAIIFLLIENRINHRLAFILTLFILYLIYSIIEITSLVREIRKTK